MPGLNGDGAGAGGDASPAPNSTTEAPRVKPPATDAPAPHPEPAVTDFLIRFSATHEEFRLPEILAIAEAEGIPLTVLEYTTTSPFCLVRLPGTAAAQRLIRRSILAQSIHEFWASGADLAALHAAMREHTAALWPRHATASFRILIDSFYGKRAQADRVAVINSFGYLPWRGAIRMADPDETFTVFEEWPRDARVRGLPDPDRLLFGRFVGTSARELVNRYDLKKRRYISTTSMDAELSLVTANLALAGPGKLVYDPFVGTGSFPLACAHFGATVFGSDIDGRSIRGRGADGRPGSGDPEQCLKANFTQYGLLGRFGDAFSADLTNSPICAGRRVFDAIVCDPPYGVREGLHVLGCRDPEKTPWAVEAGAKHWRSPDYVPPKKPYGFRAILDDLLAFAAATLVDRGRLCFWMPTANDDEELPIPGHPALEVVSVCAQPFNKWTRRLITYRRLADNDIDPTTLAAYETAQQQARQAPALGITADELNPFRRSYFKGFEP